MRSIERFMTQVRRRETPLHARLYDFAKRLRAIHIPVIPGVHHLLYEERRLRHSLWHTFLRTLYCEPMFKTRCEQVGRNLRVIRRTQSQPAIRLVW
jgi:hypothetical protein